MCQLLSQETPWTVVIRLLCLWNSSRNNTGVGSLSLLQGIFLTQGLNLGLSHCRQILYHLSPQGNQSPPEYTDSSGLIYPSCHLQIAHFVHPHLFLRSISASCLHLSWKCCCSIAQLCPNSSRSPWTAARQAAKVCNDFDVIVLLNFSTALRSCLLLALTEICSKGDESKMESLLLGPVQ